MGRRPDVLITGFGPFPGVPRNPSSALAAELARLAARALPGYTFRCASLPTSWAAAPLMVQDLVSACTPVLLVHFGVARRARGFVIETRARNLQAASPDVAGERAPDARIAGDGPAALASTLPCGLIYERLRRRGLPVVLSRDAGTYLCNAVLYRSLAWARTAPAAGRLPHCGFIHVPAHLSNPTEPRFGASRSRLSWDDALAGGLDVIAASLGNQSPSSRPSEALRRLTRPG